jgi:hypothetical protein
MKCVVCKQAETRPGVTTVTFERGGGLSLRGPGSGRFDR